ncbi:asparaginase [Kordiimonas pumila]|uniref:Asparaginase n=1 Tax=Kordiimonas pumila TaxID=2161677 RepID=A0ABV7D7Q4_9PROT|nr:asparaginase [Kordiimonas pumila]
MTNSKQLPQVAMLALGGTIAMMPDAAGGVTPKLTGEAILQMVPEAAAVADIQAHSFRQIASAHLTLADLIDVASEINRLIATGVNGIVITQGTDTIEETAFALDVLLDCAVPVVVTGAMRSPSQPGADGPANLLASIRVAASDQAREKGVLVTFNDVIHAARFVSKRHTSSTAAFQSPYLGPLGGIVEGKVRIPFALSPKPLVGLHRISDIPVPEVALLSTWIGDDGKMVTATIAAGYKGLVIEGVGGGHVTPAVAAALEQAAKTMPVIMASRTGAGEVLQNTYGFVGSEIDLANRGLLFAGTLSGAKARLLLVLLLMYSIESRAELQRYIDRWAE